jgi:hypothetical protein
MGATGAIKGYLGSTTPPDFRVGGFFGSFLQQGVMTFLGVSGSPALAGPAGSTTGDAYKNTLAQAGKGLVSVLREHGVKPVLSKCQLGHPGRKPAIINSKLREQENKKSRPLQGCFFCSLVPC